MRKNTILFLSMMGLKDQEEDLKLIDPFLASLKDYIVPHYNVKVLLFTSFKSKTKTLEQIKQYGLRKYIDLRTIDEFDLSPEALEFMSNCSWFTRIGHVMNMMFDYASRNDFWGADWIFHTDSDIIFTKNFYKTLSAIQPLEFLHEKIVITITGDSYPDRFVRGEKTLLLERPERMFIYEELRNESTLNFLKFKLEKSHADTSSQYKNDLFFISKQLKCRNDFFGISSTAAKDKTIVKHLNWVSYSYHGKYGDDILKNLDYHVNQEDKEIILDMFDQTYPHMPVQISADKGTSVLYSLEEGPMNVFQIQLPTEGSKNASMMVHYASATANPNPFYMKRFYDDLTNQFSHYEHIWGPHFEGIVMSDTWEEGHAIRDLIRVEQLELPFPVVDTE
ncbi:MAG: hypothetical protein VW683_00135 [Betaproteobacteria bacterium]|jgi:hypothetical protein